MRQRYAFLFRLMVCAILFVGLLPLTAQPVQAVSADIVISQVYGGGGNSGATYRNDFIELYNRGSVAVNIGGWSVQYAGAASSTWQVTNLAGTIAPGGYYLIQEAAGAGGSADLPTPNASGSINLSATSGKVALVNTTTELTGTCPTGGGMIDFVGYGTANCAEGTPAPALNNTSAALRINNGATDTDNNSADFVAGAPNPRSSGSTGTCAAAYTPIYAVQGSAAASPLAGQVHTIKGVVVGDFQAAGQQSGFYLQDASGDGNVLTSDGVFVHYPGAVVDVQVGDVLLVTGTVAEFNSLTELTSVTGLVECGTGSAAAATVTLPEAADDDLERYEGMLVTFPQTLTVSQNYFQGRYGQVTLSSDGRLYNPTNGNAASDSADLNARRLLVLDDGSTAQNPNPIPYIGADNTLRAGDTVSGLTGVIDYGPISSDTSIRTYRLQPTGPVTFTRANARAAAPAAVGGTLKVATFNVLNYFNGDGTGGGFPTARGADTLAEFQRQRAKIIAALVAMDADVVGLMEMERDGTGPTSAIQDLINGLNEATAPGRYAFIAEPNPGSDQIKVSLIYKPASVMPAGAAVNDSGSVYSRPPLAQTFTEAASGEQFTVVVNHFKSRNCDGATGADLDQGDGQGCYNARRTAQAQALVAFVNTLAASDPDVLVIGDLNAYSLEDPLDTLTGAGLLNLTASRVPAAERYSYVFDGWSGELDHALATGPLNNAIRGATIWHINVDEPVVIDYNTEFKSQDFYAPTPYRSSDHDPLVIGIDLANPVGAYVLFAPLARR